MKVTADTNVLVRALTDDDAIQSPKARAALADADIVALPLPALCELVWILVRGHRAAHSEVAEAIRRLIGASNVVTNRQAVEAGLAFLDMGGDFADGVIAYEGAYLGGEIPIVRQGGRIPAETTRPLRLCALASSLDRPPSNGHAALRVQAIRPTIA